MNKYSLLIVFALLFSCKESSEGLQITDGVSSELATYRKQQLSDVHYALSFSIPKKIEDPVEASMELTITVNDLQEPLVLDFKSNREYPESAMVNGTNVDLESLNEHIVIPSEFLQNGENLISMDFLAGETSLNRKEDRLSTLLVPDRARTLFPCFDQPDIKATYILNITAPKDWEVLCGAAVDQKTDKGDFVEWQFGETDKMSTYLFSFVAGEFSVLESEETARTMRMLHQETDTTKVELSGQKIFRLHQESVNFLEDYTDYPFPFQKLEAASIYSFQYSGMEHTGAIQYKQQSLFLDNSATRSQELWRAKLIAHETAHMWFGNLVTMKWFDDVWLKEVFASFMADKIAEPNFKDINHELSFFVEHYPPAYSVDRTRGANPIKQDLDNLKNAGSVYGDIIYHKAPIMMRQLEAIVGKEKFREGISEYLTTYANDNAVWNDLIAILDKKTSKDLKAWSEVWVNSPGRPIISANIVFNEDDTIGLIELVQTAEDGSDKLWPQQFEVALVYEDSIKEITVEMDGKKVRVEAASGLPKPTFIVYNSNGFGYGLFPQNTAALGAAVALEDDVVRASAYLNGFESALNGDIPIKDALELYSIAARTERNELVLNLLSGQITHLYWQYLSAEDREAIQPNLAQRLFEDLNRDVAANIKKSIFGIFRAVAHSGESREQLYQIWNKQLQIADLLLNEDDLTSIAMDLALYDHEDADQILEEARSAITDKKKKERFDFLKPALSSDATVRNEYFWSFGKEEMRAEEFWVLYSCKYIHHPLRQPTALQSLRLSLELLPEIQRTGDIFFPKFWLDQTIGQYSSKEALDILNTYLDANPDLNPKLKLKVLQATEDLYRVQEVLK